MDQDSFIGNFLSLDCGETLGTFQGEVSSVCKQGQTISLKHAFRNGIKYDVPEVTIRASDIKDLKILKTCEDLKREAQQKKEIFLAMSKERKVKKENGGPSLGKVQDKDTSQNKTNGEIGKSNLNQVRKTSNADRGSKSPHRKPPSGNDKVQRDSSAEGKQRSKQNLNHTQRSAFHSPNRKQNGTAESPAGTEKSKSGLRVRRSASFNVPHGKLYDDGMNTDRSSTPGKGSGKKNAFHRVHSVDALTAQNGANAESSNDEDGGRPTERGRRRNYSGNFESREPAQSRSSPVKIPANNGRSRGRSGGLNAKNNECFSAPVDSFLSDDFDFDSNFALFDKDNFYEELDAMGDNRPKRHGPRQLRFDENILERRESEEGKRIVCPESSVKWYQTDSAMQIPSISPELKARLMVSAADCGYTTERRLESVGICSAQVALQLIEKQRRLNCKKTGAIPSVVVLCGPHLQGAQGVSCARHLTNHGVNVTLFVPNFVKMLDELKQEINLFDQTDGIHLLSYKDLPSDTKLVDVVICALDTPNDTITPDQAWYRGVVQWMSGVGPTPVMSLDPSNTQSFFSQWGVAIGLPLEYNDNVGALYLCSGGIPKKVFESMGIRYMSPFSHGLFVQLDNS